MSDKVFETLRLLRKYIDHVGHSAGREFLLPEDRTGEFTDEEWKQLQVLVEPEREGQVPCVCSHSRELTGAIRNIEDAVERFVHGPIATGHVEPTQWKADAVRGVRMVGTVLTTVDITEIARAVEEGMKVIEAYEGEAEDGSS
ncbi:MAG: hypothetical protein GY769_07815 [bacterium]|nr:hypothetical protein [bacterium]